ncbi:MAG: hypothetical protein KKD31_13370 [Bacteroidetes bacterium]|nr:hypothetical protein [Bacteroidota bacterium]
MRKLLCLIVILSLPVISNAQREVDLAGLRQISELYKYIYKDDEFLSQLKKVGEAKMQMEAIRATYADEIAANSEDSIAIELKNAENWLSGFLQTMKERYSFETILKEFDFNQHMMGIHVKAASQTHDDPDGTWSSWKAIDKDKMKASTYLELMKIQKGEQDTSYQKSVKTLAEKEKMVAEKREVGKLKYLKSITFQVPVDAYTGSDKAQIKAKVKELFQKECTDYIVAKTYITGEDWFHNKGVQWDDYTKSFKQYDKSGIEVDIICRKKTEPSSPNGFLVQFNLIKDHLDGTTKIMVFCSDIEYKKIEVPK